MEQALLIVCLDGDFARKIAQAICDETGRFYLDCEQLLAYELADPDSIIKKCGISYLKKQECKFIKNLLDYSNTVMVMEYDLYMRDMHYKILNENLKIYYLYLEYDFIKENESVNKISKIAFNERNTDLQNTVKNVINCKNCNIEQIISQITSK